MPLNNKDTYLQRQISIRDDDETETGLEALEQPLKAKRRESETRQGTNHRKYKQAVCAQLCNQVFMRQLLFLTPTLRIFKILPKMAAVTTFLLLISHDL